jgi:hypothetical protein
MTRCCSTCRPLGWEHINLTGDYRSRNSGKIGASPWLIIPVLLVIAGAVLATSCSRKAQG